MRKIITFLLLLLLTINVFSQNYITSKKYILEGECFTTWWFETPELVFEEYSNDSTEVYVYRFGSFNPDDGGGSIQYSDTKFGTKKSGTITIPRFYGFFSSDKLVLNTETTDDILSIIKNSDSLYISTTSAYSNQTAYFPINRRTVSKIKKLSSSKTLIIFGKSIGQYKVPNPTLTIEQFGNEEPMIYLTNIGPISKQDNFSIVYWFDTSINYTGLSFEPTVSITKNGRYILRIQNWNVFNKWLKTARQLTIQIDVGSGKMNGTYNSIYLLSDSLKKELKKFNLKSKTSNLGWYPKEIERIKRDNRKN